jgi:hypothetical protein
MDAHLAETLLDWRGPAGIEYDHRELKAGLGLGHGEGCSFTGWYGSGT